MISVSAVLQLKETYFSFIMLNNGIWTKEVAGLPSTHRKLQAHAKSPQLCALVQWPRSWMRERSNSGKVHLQVWLLATNTVRDIYQLPKQLVLCNFQYFSRLLSPSYCIIMHSEALKSLSYNGQAYILLGNTRDYNSGHTVPSTDLLYYW